MTEMLLRVNKIITTACNFISLAALELAAPGSAVDSERHSQNKKSWREVAAFCVNSF